MGPGGLVQALQIEVWGESLSVLTQLSLPVMAGLRESPTDCKWHFVLLESVLASSRDDLNSLHLAS